MSADRCLQGNEDGRLGETTRGARRRENRVDNQRAEEGEEGKAESPHERQFDRARRRSGEEGCEGCCPVDKDNEVVRGGLAAAR